MWSFWCWLVGHEDIVRKLPTGKVYRHCIRCLRDTQGFVVEKKF